MQVGKSQFLHRVRTVTNNCHDADPKRHDNQTYPEHRINPADDFINRKQGCEEVVDQNYNCPESNV